MIQKMIALGLAISLIACSAETKKNNKQDTFTITSPIIIDTSFMVEYSADIHSLQNVEVRSKVKGHLENIMLTKVHQLKPVNCCLT
jgi:membrane fusion protein (multidrug efflux system)